MKTPLTEAVLRYQATGAGYDSFISEVSLTAYRYPRRFRWCTEDDCSDFFSSFFPRLQRIVTRFRDRGRPFEVYLLTCLRWHLRSFVTQRRARLKKDSVLESPSVWEGCTACDLVAEEPQDSWCLALPRQAGITFAGRFVRTAQGMRQLLLLLFKSVLHVTDNHIDHVAKATRLSRDNLFHTVENLRLTVEHRRRRLDYLSGKRNAYYFRVLYLRQELQSVPEQEKQITLRRRLTEEERRFRLCLKQISRVPSAPTHRDIATVMGIPKGTVDSSLHYLRNSLILRAIQDQSRN